MFPSRRWGGAEGLLLLCMSSTMVNGLTTTPTSGTLPVTSSPTASTSSVSVATPTPTLLSVPRSSVSTGTQAPSTSSTVSMTTTPASPKLAELPTTSETTETTLVSTTNTPTTPTPMTGSPTASTSSVSVATPTPTLLSVPRSSVSTGTQAPSTSSTPTVSMTTMPDSPTSVTTELPTMSETTETTLVSTTNTPTTPTPTPPNAEHFKAVHQTERNITLQWSMPANYTLSSFNYTLQFEENSTNIIGGPAGIMNYTVEDLEPARWYNFTLYTNEQAFTSSGVSIRALTAPESIDRVWVVDQNSSSIRLLWMAVQNVTTYLVEYRDGGGSSSSSSTVGAQAEQVSYTASPLRSATSYTFTVYSRLENVSSSGTSVPAATAPLAVTMVTVRRKLSEVELIWSRDGDSSYLLLFGDQTFSPVPTEPGSGQVSHKVSSLQEGTLYNYSITASYQRVNSSTYYDNTVTTINCSAVGWRVTNSTIQASIVGEFTDVSAQRNGSEPHNARPDPPDSVLLTGLYPGATYFLSVNYRTLLQCGHKLTLPPPDIRAQCDNETADTIVLRWALPAGVWTGVEVNVTGITLVVPDLDGKLQTTLEGLQPARTYQIATRLLSGHLKSAVQIMDCHTVGGAGGAGGVIGGSVAAVLIVLLLVALVVYFYRRRRPKPIRRPDFAGWATPSDTYKPIPADLFEDHVKQMSQDDNWGFSEEYENFIPVGMEQTCKAAIIPDNKAKNRFTNVLPYDWCRVKLSPQIEQENSDYINASYLPGYSGSKEYIAAQGPLAGTLDDFWRMVWEQGVRAIAMVTNCIEGGRAKCEQYWPLDYTPCLYGDLLVTSISEQTQPNWTIRSFTVKNRATSEQRSVQHFHFRAWPDHGVPEGTWPLLQFRELLRQHMEQEGGGFPTLVHCSAGVGRTGTLVALDVLLQQLEVEGVVDVASFVHKMRLSRPLMVQTESQYVFLHHCLLEAMQGREVEDEHTYQNLIYANATALQQMPYSNTNV